MSAPVDAVRLPAGRWLESSAVPVPPNSAQVVATWFAGAALAISLAALVVAFLAWRAARRSAAASERSAGAAESNAAIAARNEQRQAEQQHTAAGPRFVVRDGHLGQHDARVALMVEGGPGRVHVTALIEDAPWAMGFVCGEGMWDSALVPGDQDPGDVFIGIVGLSPDRDPTRMQWVLPLRITAVSTEETPRTWEQLVHITLTGGRPRSQVF